MRFSLRLALILSLVVSAVALAGIVIEPTRRFEFTDCDSGGSDDQTVTEGSYLFRVLDADTYVCWAETCASGGERFANGTVLLLSFGRGGRAISCRSTDDTGDVIFTRAD
jgi:hypothetical protein